MQVSNRVVYGRAFSVTPRWLWVLQRASGLLLGPLVALHMLVPDLAGNHALNALLLAVTLGHGYSGVKRLVAAQGRAGLYTMLALAWCAGVAVFGLLLVVAGA